MSTKVKIMLMVTLCVIAISVTAVVIILLEPCQYCGDKFCMERCLIVYDDYGDETSNKLKPQKYDTNQKTTRLSQTPDAGTTYLDDIVFIGDSRTIGLQAHGGLKEENVFAEDGLNHEVAMTKPIVKIQEFKSVTIAEAVAIRVPNILIINLGINGVSWMSPESFIETYEQFIDQIINSSSTSMIIIEAILPVSMSYESRQDGVTNEKIDEVNSLLYQLAKEKGLYYLATDEVLKNEYNDLSENLHNGDGLHYNKSTYELIVEYISTHALKKK